MTTPPAPVTVRTVAFLWRKVRASRLIPAVLLGVFFALAGRVAAQSDAGGDRGFLNAEEQAWLISHRAEFCVAPEANYPPLSFVDAGAWRGLSADMIRLLEGKLGTKFTLLAPQNLETILARAEQGAPGIITSVRETPERSHYLSFTQPYLSVPTVIIVKADSRPGRWPEAFAGKQVAVGKGYGVQKFLEQKYPDIKLVLTPDDLDGLRRLSFGEIDAVIMDVASASFLIEREKITNLRVFSSFAYAYDLSFAVRKDLPVLREILAKTLQAIPAHEQAAVLQHWVHLETEPLALLREKYGPLLPLGLTVFALLIGASATVWIIARRRRMVARNLAGALGLLAVGLFLTGIAVLFAKAEAERGAQREFDFAGDEIRLNIVARLRACAQVLHSAAALFDASASVGREEWRTFTQGLQIEQQLPGIQGVGFAQFIPRAQLADHVQAIRREGFPDYMVKPAGDRETYAAVIYVEPFSARNQRAFGYDLWSEPVRRAALARARDEQVVALSGKVTLVQETSQDVQAGTLMFFPVYRQGAPLATVAQRRAALTGWVYSPYRMTDLLRGSLQGWEGRLKAQQVEFQVYDGGVLSADTLLFDSQGAGNNVRATTAQLTRLTPVDFAGRRWTLRFTQTGGLAARADYSSAWFAFLGGTIISLLLFWLALSLLDTRANARRQAAQLTQKLRESERRFAVMADTVPVLIWESGTDKLCHYFNKTWLDFTGRTLAQEMGNGWAEGVHPDDLARYLEVYLGSFDARKDFAMEYRLRRHDGEYRWLLDHGVPRFAADGSFAGYIGSCVDITESKRSVAALQKSEERHTLVERAVDEALWERNLDADDIYCSPRWKALLGYEEDDLPKRLADLVGLVHSDDRARVKEALRSHLEERMPYAVEYRLRHKDGRYRWMLSRGEAVRDVTGRPIRMLGAITDITERKLAAEQIENSSRLLHSVLESSRDIIAMLDTDYRYVLFNSAFHDECQRIFGRELKPGESMLQALAHLPDDLAAAKASWDRALGGEDFTITRQFGDAARERHWYELHFSPVRDRTGMILGAAHVVRNITERKRAEAVATKDREHYHTLLETASDGIHILDPDGNLLEASPSFYRMLGYEPGNPPPLNVKDWDVQWSPEELKTRIAQLLRQTAVFQTRHRRRDGQILEVEINGRGIEIDGRPHLYASARDITGRKRAEDEIHRLLDFNRGTLDSLTAHLCVLDESGRILTANRAWREFARANPPLAASVVEGANYLEVCAKVTGNDRAIAHKIVSGIRAVSRGELVEFLQEYPCHSPTEQRWFLVRITRFSEAGQVRIVVAHINVTQRTLDQAALKESQARLADAMDQAHLAHWEMDAATTTCIFNDRFYALYGTTAEREGGYRMPAAVYAREFLLPEEQHIVSDFVANLLADNIDALQQEHHIRRRDGELRHILAHITVMRDAAGRVVGTRGTNQDISNLRRAEQALRQSDEWFHTVVAAMAEGVVLQLADATIIDCNAQAEKILGLTRDQVLGRTSLDPRWNAVKEDGRPFPGDEHPAVISLRTGRPCSNVVMGLNLPDGSFRWININAEPITRAGETTARAVVCTFSDITDRIAHQQKLQALLGQTERDARIKGELLREVNHRVTNNLTAVLGLMAFENRHSSGDPRSIASALERLSQRIRGLLHVHRMLSQSAWAPVSVHELAGQIIRAALNAAHGRQATVVNITPGDLRVSPRQAGTLAMVVNELATNTVKYAGLAAGAVAISFEATRDAGGLTLCYRDNGPGYPPDVLAGRRANIGLKLIHEMTTKTLGGSVVLANDRGAVTTLRIPAEEETRT